MANSVKIGRRVIANTGARGEVVFVSEERNQVTIKLANNHRRFLPLSSIEWVKAPLSEFEVGDVIEDPSNSATWTVEQIEGEASTRYVRAGSFATTALATREFWKEVKQS